MNKLTHPVLIGATVFILAKNFKEPIKCKVTGRKLTIDGYIYTLIKLYDDIPTKFTPKRYGMQFQRDQELLYLTEEEAKQKRLTLTREQNGE